MVGKNWGHILTGTKIAVDWWESDNTPLVDSYFCSHVTSDHMPGLSKSWSKPIHCSEITGNLLKLKYKISSSLIITLPYTTVTRLSDSLYVVLHDSNYSVGSAMFLFEGKFGRILYTGNFRWYPDLARKLSNYEIDTVYFDNTHSRKGSTKFVTREECKLQLAEFCKFQLESNRVVYFILESIGKEDILQHVAQALGVKIVVSKEKYQVVKCMGMAKFFTVSENNGKLFFVAKSKFNFNKVSQKLRENHMPNEVVFVKITGMRRGQNCEAYKYIYFSEHSSMQEIEVFFDSLDYKSATPIITRVEKNPGLNKTIDQGGPNASTTDSDQKQVEKLKVRLRKNRSTEEQTSFTITSEFEMSVALQTPRYRVVTGQSTDEEAGDSPGTMAGFSPIGRPLRTCSTPLESSMFNQESSPAPDSSPSSPSKVPYIEPPIDLDWVLSPIKTSQAFSSPEVTCPSNKPPFRIDKLCSTSSDSSIEILGENEMSSSLHRRSSDTPFVLSPCDVGVICNSPVYGMNGKVSYVTQTPTVEKEVHHDLSSSVDHPHSDLGQIYEEMFRETEVPLEIKASLVNDLCDDMLNSSGNSVETLHVSDTESDTDGEMEGDGPIGDYLRGQYALNQIFNSSVIDIRDAFAPSTAALASYPQRVKKSSEADLANAKIELIMPKVNDLSDSNEELAATLQRVKQLKNSKEEYFRCLSEIAKRGYQITYNKKPKKIGKSLPQNLLSESINLINNCTNNHEFDDNIRHLARKLTFDDAFCFNHKMTPVLNILRRPLTPSELCTLPRHGQFPGYFHGHQHSSPLIMKQVPTTQIHSSKRQQVDLACYPSPGLEIFGHSNTSRYSRAQPSASVEKAMNKKIPLKQVTTLKPPGQSSVNLNAVRQRQKSAGKAAINSGIHDQDNIFDTLFGSTPTSAIKRVKKRTKEQGTSCKRGNVSHGP